MLLEDMRKALVKIKQWVFSLVMPLKRKLVTFNALSALMLFILCTYATKLQH